MTSKQNSKSRRRPVPEQQVLMYPPYPPYPQPYAYPSVSISVLSARNATVAKVVVAKTTNWAEGPDYTFEAADSAKREQGDVYSPQTGELMALGRALQRAGRAMTREAGRQVRAAVAEQAKLREQNSKPRAQVSHRTLAEWEQIQRNNAFAGRMNLPLEEDFEPGKYHLAAVYKVQDVEAEEAEPEIDVEAEEAEPEMDVEDDSGNEPEKRKAPWWRGM